MCAVTYTTMLKPMEFFLVAALESSVLIDKIVMNTDNACKVAWEKLRLIIKGN